MTKKISAVLFDLDGVLVDTRRLHFDALSRALGDLGLELSFEEHQRIYDGLPTHTKIEILKDRFELTPEQISFLNLRKQLYTVELLQNKIVPNEDHFRMFSLLKENGIRIAICSNTKRKTLDFIVEQLKISEFIEFTLSHEDIEKPKPSPDIYIKAINRLNIRPEETIVFEDSPHGIESAMKANLTVERVIDVSDLTFERIQKIVS